MRVRRLFALAALATIAAVAAPGQSEAFTPSGVTACLLQARTSSGVPTVDRDPFAARQLRARTVLSFFLVHGDIGSRGVTIAFAWRVADTLRLQRAAFARISRRQGPRFARSLVFRRRSNVVFWYQRQTARETVRIADHCLPSG